MTEALIGIAIYLAIGVVVHVGSALTEPGRPGQPSSWHVKDELLDPISIGFWACAWLFVAIHIAAGWIRRRLR